MASPPVSFVSKKVKRKRLALSCLLKREVLESIGTTQLHTIGRSNLCSEREESAVISVTPAASERNEPAPSPAANDCVFDEDCVISHIQPPPTNKRGPTDSGPLLVNSKPVPPLKIKRVKGHDGSVTYRVQRFEGTTSACSGVNTKDLNMRVWSREYWVGQGTPSIPVTLKREAALKSSDVVDLTLSSEDEGVCSDSASCARVMEFRQAITRSQKASTASQISGPSSNGILVHSSSIPSSVPSTNKSSMSSPSTLPTYSPASKSLTASASNTPFQLHSMLTNPDSSPSLMSSVQGSLRCKSSYGDPPLYPDTSSVLGSAPPPSSNTQSPPRTPRITPPKTSLSWTARVHKSSHFTEPNHRKLVTTTRSVGSSFRGLTRLRPHRVDEDRNKSLVTSSSDSRVERRVQFSIPQRSTNVAGRKSVETMTVNVNMDRESILKDEDVFDVKTIGENVHFLVKQPSNPAPQWISAAQCKAYLQWKSFWKVQISQCNGGKLVVPEECTKSEFSSTFARKSSIPNGVKDNGAEVFPSTSHSLPTYKTCKGEPMDLSSGSSSVASNDASSVGSSNAAGASTTSISTQTDSIVSKNKLNDYQLQLCLWQTHLNRQQRGREVPISVENKVDLAPVPLDFTYITKSIRSEGIPSSEVLLGCKCQKCDATCKQCCSGLAGCPFPYTKCGRLRVAPGMPIYECNAACRCSSACYNRIVQNGRVIPLTIFRTHDGRGWGVKTRQTIKKNSFVTEYVGEIITNKEAEMRGAIYDEEGATYLFDLDFHEEDVDDGEDSLFTIDARKFGNISHFINHSCDPNLQVYSVWIETLDHRLPHLAFFALKDINEDEELTFDYNMGRNMDNITSKPKIKCLCGAESCAGFLF